MSNAEKEVRKKHHCRTHVRAALASINQIAINCDPKDYKLISEARSILEVYKMKA